MPPVSARLVAALAVLAALAAACPEAAAQTRAFGRNKVQYDTFDWRVLRTEHLEVHFYPEEEALARRAAEYGEAACDSLDAALGHRLTKRIPVVVWASHYHFRQNNVSPSLVGESTGGFTEIFRNRVVLPYAGSEEEFRHVIHHELVHAYVFDKLYGGPVRSFFVLQYAFPVPLWFMEGIAEWYSNRWDPESEMMIRDAAIQGSLPPFPRIRGGFFVYKAGWSAVGYLVARHGEGVIPRILDELPRTRDLAAAILNATGEDVATIGADWLKDVRRACWPTLATLEEPDRLGRVLTPGPGVDLDGVLSPDGDRVAFLSTRSGTPDLWILDLDGEGREPRVLVHGARGGKFESLHPRRSSVGFSPDGRYLVAAAQKGARDALYVLDVGNGRTLAEIVPELDALERPDWSPAEARFVFTGMRGGQVDLWAVDADGTRLARLTDDLFEERGPRWSPDGRRVAFASDRLAGAGMDLFVLETASGRVEAVSTAPGDQIDPAWSADGKTLWHVSEEHGTRDLVALDVATGTTRRVTRWIGGADAPSAAREGGRLLVGAYAEGGFDLVLVEDADTLATVEAPPVEVPARPWDGRAVRPPRASPPDTAAAPDPGADTLGPETVAEEAREPAEPELVPYRPRFRTEWILGSFGYSGYGFHGGIRTAVSDVLGNHRFALGASVFRELENSDAFVSYSWLPRRVDWGLSAFHVRDYLYDDRTTLGHPIGEEGDDAFFSERQWGGALSAVYPFHTFRRVAFDLTALGVERVRFTEESRELGAGLEETGRGRSSLLLPRISHTFDNSLWGWTGPVQGSRTTMYLQHSVPLGGERLSYGTALADVRRYRRFGEYVVALRAMGAVSFGEDPQEFQLGGPHTIRGWPRQSIRGRHAALASVEFRYPFLEQVRFGWPVRSGFGGVRGNLFLDVGGAFDEPRRLRWTAPNAEGETALSDLRVGFGVGARLRLAYLPLRFDVGWATDGASVGSPRWHFTIGPEF